MGVRTWALILCWIAAVFVGGIAAAQTPSEVPFTTIAAGKISGVRTPTQIVVRDVAAWRSLWVRHAGSGVVPPAVDFNREMVIAFYAGAQPQSVVLAIHRIVREPERLVVYYMLAATRPLPQPEEGSTITPFQIVRLPRVALPVAVVLRRTPPVLRPSP